MPHLSPMKWLTMILLLWLLTMLMSSTHWWHQLTSWPKYNSSKLQTKSKWLWTYKGGRKMSNKL